MKRDPSPLLYGTLLLTATGLAGQLLGFLYRIALSRQIGAEVMGLYQLIMPVYSVLLSLTAVGLTAAVSNLSARFHALGRRGAMERTLSLSLRTFLLLAAVLGAAVVVLYDPISVYLLGDARTQLGLLLLPACVVLTGVENLHKHQFYGIGRVRPPALVELAEQFVRTGAVLGLLAVFLPQNAERTVGLIVLGMIVCEVFSAGMLMLLRARARRRDTRPPGPPEPGLGRQIVGIAVPVGLTAVLGNLMNSANSVLIPARLVAGGMEVSQAMSIFGVVCGMTLPMLTLPMAFLGAVNLMLAPGLAESTALGRRRETHCRIHQALLATSVVALPCTALMAVIGPTIGAALFQEPTVGKGILPLAVGVVFSCYQGVLGAALNGVGRQPAAARNALISGGVQLLFTATLTGLPGVGLGGFLLGFVASGLVGALLNGVSLVRAVGLPLRLFQWITAPGLASLLMGLCVNLLFRELLRRGLAALPAALACGLFGAVLYLAALSAQGVGWRDLTGRNCK